MPSRTAPPRTPQDLLDDRDAVLGTGTGKQRVELSHEQRAIQQACLARERLELRAELLRVLRERRSIHLDHVTSCLREDRAQQ